MGTKKMNHCKEYLKAFRKQVGAKKDEKIDKRYKPYLAPNDKYYSAHCGYCAKQWHKAIGNVVVAQNYQQEEKYGAGAGTSG